MADIINDKERELVNEYKTVKNRCEELKEEILENNSDQRHAHKQYTAYCELLTVIYWRLLDKHGIDMHINKRV